MGSDLRNCSRHSLQLPLTLRCIGHLTIDQPYDAVGLGGDCRIVRNHDYREAVLAVQGSQNSQNFLPGALIEISRRLVGQ